MTYSLEWDTYEKQLELKVLCEKSLGKSGLIGIHDIDYCIALRESHGDVDIAHKIMVKRFSYNAWLP